MSIERWSNDAASAEKLREPLRFEFSGLNAPNRFLKAAMTERLSSWHPTDTSKRGIPSDGLINVYQRWGERGYGLILTGNIMIDLEHLEAGGNAIIPKDASFEGERFDAFKKLASATKTKGALIYGQLSHPGRQAPEEIQPHPVSASDVQLEKNPIGSFGKPIALTSEGIQDIVEKFAHSAEFLHKAGFDGAELHGAHGYLLSQFLSPTTNLRNDRYGGSLENRSRIVFEIADAIRARVPDTFSLSIKLNSVEFQDKGFSTEDCKTLCQNLEKHQFDWVELSGGTYQAGGFGHRRESTKKREAFFLDFSEMIVPALTETKVYVTGGLRSTGAMVKALDTIHGVGLGRPACWEFDIPNKLLSGKVLSAIKTRLDEQNFGITNIAAGTM